MIDIARARAETPGTAHVAHLNNAGAALAPEPVLDAVTEHLRLEATVGAYEAAARQADRIERTYELIAAMIGCAPDEIALVENATRAWDMAFYALPFTRGDRILTTGSEYASNYIALRQVADRTGASIEFLPEDESGGVDVEALAQAIDERVKLVSLVHVPSQSGLVQPAAAVGAITRAAGVPLLLDACQSVGQMPIDVAAIGCDMLSATGRKFLRGPRGTGFLFMRRELAERLEPPLLDVHAARWRPDGTIAIRPDVRRFENWESYVAGRIGLGAAVEHALGWGLDDIRERVFALARELRGRLAGTPGVTVHDRGRELCGIVTFSVEGTGAPEVAGTLRRSGVNVSVLPASWSPADFAARGLGDSIVRASAHYYNTEDELDRLVSGVRALAGGQSTLS